MLNACPKLDDSAFYLKKLTEIIQVNDLSSIDVVYMEVPCCGGLVRLVESAISASGKKIPVKFTRISIRGEIIEERTL